MGGNAIKKVPISRIELSEYNQVKQAFQLKNLKPGLKLQMNKQLMKIY